MSVMHSLLASQDSVVLLADMEIPNPDPAPIPGMEPVAKLLFSWLKWIAALTGAFMLVVAFIKMKVAHNNQNPGMAASNASQIPITLIALGGALASIGIIQFFVDTVG